MESAPSSYTATTGGGCDGCSDGGAGAAVVSGCGSDFRTWCLCRRRVGERTFAEPAPSPGLSNTPAFQLQAPSSFSPLCSSTLMLYFRIRRRGKNDNWCLRGVLGNNARRWPRQFYLSLEPTVGIVATNQPPSQTPK
jgi:hypothetical protein